MPQIHEVAENHDPNAVAGYYGFYNGAPKVEGEKVEIEGKFYPYNTRATQVLGKWWVVEPEDVLMIPYRQRDVQLILEGIKRHLTPWGVVRIDWRELATKGEDDYFAELAVESQNILCEAIKRDVIDVVAKENEYRVARKLEKRSYDDGEKAMVELREGLMTKLRKQGDLSSEERMRRIREAAEKDVAGVNLPGLSYSALKSLAKDQEVLVPIGTSKARITEIMQRRFAGEAAAVLSEELREEAQARKDAKKEE